MKQLKKQTFADAEIVKCERMIKKLRKGSIICFNAISDLTGQTLELEGIIIGGAKEIKKIQPEEFGGMEDVEKAYLVERMDGFGNKLRYVVFPEEIIEKGTLEREAI